MKDMLKKGNKLVILIFALTICSCETPSSTLKEISQKQINLTEYSQVYTAAQDSINMWSANKVGYFANFGQSKNCLLDSLLCFNGGGTRLISCILMQQLRKDGVADDINFFYGEKIDNSWYFFIGDNIFLPRSFHGEKQGQPMGFNKLHEIALKEVYAGYLDASGNINEKWFVGHFEGPGWGLFEDQASFDWFLKGKRFKTKKEYFEYVHKESALGIWANRDTTQPIKRPDTLKKLP